MWIIISCRTLPMNKKGYTNKLGAKEVSLFKKTVLSAYRKNKRNYLPWRKTVDPYSILVSEIMLQQTQVERVIKKYTAWIERFPTVNSVHEATQKEILTYWQGLGYNRRALYLKKACSEITTKHNGVFPTAYKDLLLLPGIGQSTAGAIINFAYNKPQSFIETNIRTIFLHHFFKNTSSVLDIKILELVESTIDKKNPREWFYALYDYGTMLKKELGAKKTLIHKQSKHYSKQSKFQGSNRQVRGAVLRHLLANPSKKWWSLADLVQTEEISKSCTAEKLELCLTKLCKEGLLTHSEKSKRFAIL